MGDVREELLGVIVENLRARQGGDSQSLTNAILARFDLTPKPAVSALELGGMVARAAIDLTVIPAQRLDDDSLIRAGAYMAAALKAAGLTVVRIEGDGSYTERIARSYAQELAQSALGVACAPAL